MPGALSSVDVVGQPAGEHRSGGPGYDSGQERTEGHASGSRYSSVARGNRPPAFQEPKLNPSESSEPFTQTEQPAVADVEGGAAVQVYAQRDNRSLSRLP